MSLENSLTSKSKHVRRRREHAWVSHTCHTSRHSPPTVCSAGAGPIRAGCQQECQHCHPRHQGLSCLHGGVPAQSTIVTGKAQPGRAATLGAALTALQRSCATALQTLAALRGRPVRTFPAPSPTVDSEDYDGHRSKTDLTQSGLANVAAMGSDGHRWPPSQVVTLMHLSTSLQDCESRHCHIVISLEENDRRHHCRRACASSEPVA